MTYKKYIVLYKNKRNDVSNSMTIEVDAESGTAIDAYLLWSNNALYEFEFIGIFNAEFPDVKLF